MEKGKKEDRKKTKEKVQGTQSPENASAYMTERNRTNGNAITNIQSETLKQNITSDGAAEAHTTLTEGMRKCKSVKKGKKSNWQ